ncbi:MAG: GNAT family N-acetyltransferase [Myxococcales bacterium]|nr:GNAT family N-acetyltransferase [Myxococcales bacterium]
MLAIPPRTELRARPIVGDRVEIVPMEGTMASQLWDVVDGSRAWLRPWLPWVPYQKSLDAAQRFADASVADWDSGRALRFAIRERGKKQLLGVVGLESCVEMHRSCDLGYWLRKEAAGKGLMTEAATLCVDFGFRTVGVHRMRVAAATDNYPSLRVIGRLQFKFEGIARHAEWCDGRWLDHAVFAMLDTEWRTSAGARR